jgi:branched-chain amino acid transport system ATP-binding protein
VLLEVRDLHVRHGRVHAVRGVSLHLAEGEVVAVLGANGAGKSSLLRALLGLAMHSGGSMIFASRDIGHWSISRRVREGLVLVPEGRRIVINLTVHENLLMGAFNRRDGRAVAAEIAGIYDRFPNLAARQHKPASVLSGGEQQMLAIGRGLLAKPRLMMLDEPSLGLSPMMSNEVFSLIGRLNRENGLSILLVEQNTHRALELADRAYVLELGKVAMEGSPDLLLTDRTLQDAYLGQSSGLGRRGAARGIPAG